MISVLIGKGLCSLGVHAVNLWEYRQEGICTQDGVCRRCNVKREQIEHDYRRKDGRGTKTTCDRCNKRAARRGGLTAGLVARTAVVAMLVVA